MGNTTGMFASGTTLFVEGSWQLKMQELKSLLACKVSFVHLNLQRQLHSKKTRCGFPNL